MLTLQIHTMIKAAQGKKVINEALAHASEESQFTRYVVAQCTHPSRLTDEQKKELYEFLHKKKHVDFS